MLRKFETEESTLKATKDLQTGLEFDGYVHLKQERKREMVMEWEPKSRASGIGNGALYHLRPQVPSPFSLLIQIINEHVSIRKDKIYNDEEHNPYPMKYYNIFYNVKLRIATSLN